MMTETEVRLFRQAMIDQAEAIRVMLPKVDNTDGYYTQWLQDIKAQLSVIRRILGET